MAEGSSLLIDREALFDWKGDVDEGIHYRRSPAGNSYLERITDEVYKQISLGSLYRYTEDPHNIEPAEQYEFMKFFLHLGISGHSFCNHRRVALNRPYWAHSVDAFRSEAKYGVSFAALSPGPIHDLEEEWVANPPLSIKASGIREADGLKKYHALSTAIFLGIGILAYEFVNRAFKQPERFYPHINSIMRVVNNMTRRLDEDYFSNIDDIFYNNRKNDPEVWQSRIQNMDKISGILKLYFGIKDRKLVNNFIRDVYEYKPSEEEREKTRRRTIMADLADISANCFDYKGIPYSKRANIIAKAFIILNERRNLSCKKKKEESREGLNRIVQQSSDLELALAKKRGIIDATIRTIKISSKDREDAEKNLEKYGGTEGFNMIMLPDEDPTEFAGTLYRCIQVLKGKERRILEEDDPVKQYIFFRVMQEQVKAHHLDPMRRIRGLSTKNFKDPLEVY